MRRRLALLAAGVLAVVAVVTLAALRAPRPHPSGAGRGCGAGLAAVGAYNAQNQTPLEPVSATCQDPHIRLIQGYVSARQCLAVIWAVSPDGKPQELNQQPVPPTYCGAS